MKLKQVISELQQLEKVHGDCNLVGRTEYDKFFVDSILFEDGRIVLECCTYLCED